MKLKQIISADAVVVGTGAAGYNVACRIRQLGSRNVVMVTENVNHGTSRNTGSDKQTYYKLGLCGDTADSISAMAQDLFAGGSMDGDTAYCEAALSTRCFLNLCELGVPFPMTRYGEYAGYKTDHDPHARATSVGPLTSKHMVQALEEQARKLKIPIFDGLLAVEVLKEEKRCCGLLCLEITTGDYIAFQSDNVILATGGPAGIYADSVYPTCHTGSSSLAIAAGAKMQNLTEWQYGLASVAPRWNVSGTYMQVLPRFVSVDEEGNEYEFLLDFFQSPYEALSAVFLKGYQWPFDSRKVLTGSSVIDLLVYRQRVLLNRKVYLDYTKNPFGLEDIDYAQLSGEAYDYLRKAGACFGTPIDRLKHMNQPAVDLYASKGVALEECYLEIALCAQHHNGGIAVDLWWQTSMKGLFAIGECAGTHGVVRPGGSALNSGQVGGLRAAQWICAKPVSNTTSITGFAKTATEALAKHIRFQQSVLAEQDNADEKIRQTRRAMSDFGGALRNTGKMARLLTEIQAEQNQITVSSRDRLYLTYQYQDILLVQQAVLTAMLHYAGTATATRGSALYYHPEGTLRDGLEEQFRFQVADGIYADQVQEVTYTDDGFTAHWRKVRPLPREDTFFENIWRTYRENQNIY